MKYTWARKNGYEVSTAGDRRFSAFNAIMLDGRSLECHYQCDCKGYDPGGTNWKLGKAKPPVLLKSYQQLWEEYLGLWKIWSSYNLPLLRDLYIKTALNTPPCYILTDRYANTPINQAHALSIILNELIQNGKSN